jgi:hypothetical protein
VLAKNKITNLGSQFVDVDTDTDSDNIGDELDEDDDGDGYSDEVEKKEGSDPLDPSSTPKTVKDIRNSNSSRKRRSSSLLDVVTSDNLADSVSKIYETLKEKNDSLRLEIKSILEDEILSQKRKLNNQISSLQRSSNGSNRYTISQVNNTEKDDNLNILSEKQTSIEPETFSGKLDYYYLSSLEVLHKIFSSTF